MPLGIYIHLPLCKTRCPYCDFYSQTDSNLAQAIIDAILCEIRLSNDTFRSEENATVYLGGGTPSCFSVPQIASILMEIQNQLIIDDVLNNENTIEINPDDLTIERLHGYFESGLNRLSLGTQSFNDRELSLLGRRHDSTANYRAIALIEKSAIDNFSLDLIFGLPGQTLRDFEFSLKTALDVHPQHISLYCLTFEKGTDFYKRRESGKLIELNSEIQNQMYLRAVELLSGAGFRQYEISNFAIPGRESKHNLNYWNLGEYIGLGPAAHSHLGNTRSANVPDVHRYIECLSRSELPVDSREEISAASRLEELLMLSLRQPKGLNLADYKNLSGADLPVVREPLIENLLNKKLALIEGNYLRLTLHGFLVVDEIISVLL